MNEGASQLIIAAVDGQFPEWAAQSRAQWRASFAAPVRLLASATEQREYLKTRQLPSSPGWLARALAMHGLQELLSEADSEISAVIGCVFERAIPRWLAAQSADWTRLIELPPDSPGDHWLDFWNRSLVSLLAPVAAAGSDLPPGAVFKQAHYPAWSDLLLGRLDGICVEPDDHPEAESSVDEIPEDMLDVEHVSSTSSLVFPGAFHPFHQGHRRMAELAEQRFGQPVEFEISIVNVDKPTIDFLDLEQRLASFRDWRPAWLTRAATFAEKAELFPSATFIVGCDTMARIADVHYYRSQDDYRQSLRRLAELDCGFLVFGRHAGDTFVTLQDLPLPEDLRSRCEEIPAGEFQVKMSSSRLRQEVAWEGNQHSPGPGGSASPARGPDDLP